MNPLPGFTKINQNRYEAKNQLGQGSFSKCPTQLLSRLLYLLFFIPVPPFCTTVKMALRYNIRRFRQRKEGESRAENREGGQVQESFDFRVQCAKKSAR